LRIAVEAQIECLESEDFREGRQAMVEAVPHGGKDARRASPERLGAETAS
jgi:hypothetical protein